MALFSSSLTRWFRARKFTSWRRICATNYLQLTKGAREVSTSTHQFVDIKSRVGTKANEPEAFSFTSRLLVVRRVAIRFACSSRIAYKLSR